MSGTVFATAPFDHAKADIILRSSDDVYFRVFKLFLSLASPVFETLFDIPQPEKASDDQEVKDGLFVISLTEDSKTLDALLRFCYPCTLAEDPCLEALKDIVDVLEAARKYSLDAIEKKARQAITTPKILEAEPLGCFAIAHRGLLREETLLAAKHTLTQPLIPIWFQEIDMITATDLLSLLTYHKKCGDAVYALRDDLSWIAAHYGSIEACSWVLGRLGSRDLSGHCNYCENARRYCNCGHANGPAVCACPKSTTPRYMLFEKQALQWWYDFMEGTFTELRDKPSKATVHAAVEKTVQTVKARNCSTCSPAITEKMRDLSDLLVSKVEEAVSQIELELSS